MSDFEHYIYDAVVKVMAQWHQDEADDTYIVALGIHFTEEDGKFGNVVLMNNTLSNFQQRIPDAWDADEARWNCAFWIHAPNDVCNSHIYGPMSRDLNPANSKFREEWLQALGFLPLDLPYTSSDEQKAEEASIILCGRVVAKLHTSGFIKERFERRIPVVLYMASDQNAWDDLVHEQTQLANSPEVAKDFRRWMFKVS